MQIISSCTVFCMLILAVFTGQENKNQTISLSPAKVTAVPGLCALVSCNFTCPVNAESIMWYKCKNNTEIKKCTNENKAVNKRTKKLECDLILKNCSFIMENITADDEGEYELRENESQGITNSHRLKIIIQDQPVIEVPALREREQANLSCSAPSPCPKTPPNITWWITKGNGQFTEVNNKTTFTTSEGFYKSTLTFTPTSELHNATVRCDVSYGDKKNISTNKTIEVMYAPTLRILCKYKVNEGDTLGLSCTVDSHPASSDLVWILNGIKDKLINHSSQGNLTVTNVSTQHAEEYVCTVNYVNQTWNTSININVVCNTTEITNLSDIRKIKAFLDMMIHKTTLVFLMGMAASATLFSVLLCCWVSCKRAKKTKVQTAPTDSPVNLKMVQTNIDLTVTNEQTPLQNQSDAGMSNTPVESTRGEEEFKAGGAEDGEAGEAAAGDIDYAAIDYSLLRKKSLEEVEGKSMDPDYAEIKIDGKGRKALQNEHDHTKEQRKNEEEELYSDPDALKGHA